MTLGVRAIVFFSSDQGIVTVKRPVQLDDSRLGRKGDFILVVHNAVGTLRDREARSLQQCVPVCGENVAPRKLQQSSVELSGIEISMSDLLLQEQVQTALSKGLLILLG